MVGFFVFYRCDQDLDEVCVVRASNPVAVPRCSALLTVVKAGGISGKVKVSCKDGIDPADPAFGLDAQNVAWHGTVFRDSARKVAIKFRDRGGEEVTGQDLKDKIQNLDINALDDVVGTYLADDNLPSCP